MWNLAGQSTLFHVNAHEGVTRNLEFTPDGESLMSVGNDNTIKTWKVPSQLDVGDDEEISPTSTRICKVKKKIYICSYDPVIFRV
jgi:WD40 repeat protein